ncbi:hypothetical protein LCGC14_2606020, partial [marine sediment metagenome]
MSGLKNLKQKREKAINLEEKKILISNYIGTFQEKDLSELPNCNGYGRIHHFNMKTSPNWPKNPLPNFPACRSLNIETSTILRAEIFQVSMCNLNCWYCFVPSDLLIGNLDYAMYLSASDMISKFMKIEDKPNTIILSGGQPDLVPEWLYWMMLELKRNQLNNEVYLWSDDNLTTDFFFTVLSIDQINFIKTYQNYGKVGCFKGFDPKSFSFNIQSNNWQFKQQFVILNRYIELNIDVYAYVTLTAPEVELAEKRINSFIDKLQAIRYNLPLRTIPLEIKRYSPISSISKIFRLALENQHYLVKIWMDCLKERYSKKDLKKPITEIN